jgi:hypothetical protein
MGRPLRKLHHIHSVSPCDLDIFDIRSDILQYPHHDPLRTRPRPKRMAPQGFVSKNDRLEKVHRWNQLLCGK